MNVKRTKLSFGIFISFVFVAVLMLTAMWFIFNITLPFFYSNAKRDEIVVTSNEVVGNFLESELSDTDYIKFLNETARTYETCIQIVRVSDDRTVYSIDVFGSNCILHSDSNAGMFSYYQMLASGERTEIKLQAEENSTGVLSLVYGTICEKNGEKFVFFFNTILEPLDFTLGIIRRLMLFAGLIVLVLSSVVAFFVSVYVSMPITRITKYAKQLASGDYNTRFPTRGYEEAVALSQTLNFAAEEISKVDGFRKDLLANISHDLRTPLTMIRAYAEMIRDISGENPDKRNEHLLVIIDETERLSMLVSDLMNLSKMQSGAAFISSKIFSMSDKLWDVMRRYEVLRERQGYDITLDCRPGLYVAADEPKIEQVLYNLINNAVNYTGEDKKVTVRLYEKDGYVRFEVEDTGEGIPQDKLDSIWDRYYRAPNNYKRVIVGTGLGLTIVSSILDLHKAKYGVDSHVGQGSVFWFELQRTAPEDA